MQRGRQVELASCGRYGHRHSHPGGGVRGLQPVLPGQRHVAHGTTHKRLKKLGSMAGSSPLYRLLLLFPLLLLCLSPILLSSTAEGAAAAATAPSRGAQVGIGIPLLVAQGDFQGVRDTAMEFARSLGEETGGRVFVSNVSFGVAPPVVLQAVRAGRAVGLGPPGNNAEATGIDSRTVQYLQNDVPFGMSAAQFATFLRHTNFSRFWEELYRPLGVRPYHAGVLSGAQLGGWFKRPIARLSDFRGLTIRYTGNPIDAYQGWILREVGATPVAVPGAQVKQALANGTLDGSEVLGPLADVTFRFWEAGGEVLHFPGFQGPESAHFLVPEEVVAVATDRAVRRAAQDALALNSAVFYGPATQTVLDTFDRNGVAIRRMPAAVVRGLYRVFKKVEARHRAQVGRANPGFAQIIDEYNAYLRATINHAIMAAPEAQWLPARDDLLAPWVGTQPTRTQTRTDLCTSA